MPWSAARAREWRAANRERDLANQRARRARNSQELNAVRRRKYDLLRERRTKQIERMELTAFALDSYDPLFKFVYRNQVRVEKLHEPLPTW